MYVCDFARRGRGNAALKKIHRAIGSRIVRFQTNIRRNGMGYVSNKKKENYGNYCALLHKLVRVQLFCLKKNGTEGYAGMLFCTNRDVRIWLQK